MTEIFLDGDFPTNKDCKYHCSPSCHPGQIDKDKWHYGCLHKAYPQNKYGDFCPFVECGGKMGKCELKKTKLLKRYMTGLKTRINNQKKKLELLENDYRYAKIMDN